MGKIIFRKIGQYQYSSEALIYKGRLEAENIEVFMRDGHTIDSNPLISSAIGGVKLFVKQENYESAIKVLSEISTFSLDDKNELLKCPNCGAEKIRLMTTIKDAKSLFSFVFSVLITVALPFYNKYKYKCDDCNFEF
jgi:predicted RNA-binding Zn-ribbon protein involved in translation (DUF1610 family)